jgi:hydrophobic/amphiphilic exporter-1 (mainly G- bacteria), HAE1 family
MDRRSASHFTTDRPVAVLMVFLAAVVFGSFSFGRLPVTLMPDLTYPTLTVRTEYPGTAPEEVENEISRPIEEALGVIGGLNKLSSISRAGISDVVLEFLWGTDMSKATQEAMEKLDLVFLPREAERPLLLHFDPALDPILELALTGEGTRYEGEPGLRRLRRLAEIQVKRALEPIPGVAAVRVRGGLDEEYHVLLSQNLIVRTGLSIQQVIDRLRQENINVAGGTLKEGRSEYMVRTLNEYTSLEEIAQTVLFRFEGREVRVGDIAEVVRTQRDRDMITRSGGRESVQIDIYKEADANIVAVAKAVRAAVGAAASPPASQAAQVGAMNRPRSSLAERLHDQENAALEVVADRSVFIESSILEVRNTAILGGLLAIFVLYLFLRDFKTTAILGVSIPISLLIAFAPLHLLGVSLNIMSLGGLALGVGMLVDSSIVVLESIFRCREEGDDLRAAALRGTREVRGAVAASTFTTAAVFLPLVFVEGIAGQAFSDLALAVVISLLAALAVALYFIPMLASRRSWQVQLLEPGVATSHFPSVARFRHQWRATSLRWRAVRWPWWLALLVVGILLESVGLVLMVMLRGLLLVLVRGLVPATSRVAHLLLNPVSKVTQSAIGRLTAVYPKLLGRVLVRPIPVFALIGLGAWVTWYAASMIETELLPEVHQGEFTLEVSLPVGTPIEETSARLARVEEAILARPEEIQTLIVSYGYDVTNLKRSDEGEHTARFKVILDSGRDPVGTEDRVRRRLRALFADLPDVDVRITRPVLFSTRAPLVIEIEGDDLATLSRMAQGAVEVLAPLPALADVETTLRRGAPEIQVIYDRDKLSVYGLTIQTVAHQVRDMVKGFEASRFNLKDRRIPIVVRLDEDDRGHLDDIGRLVINPGGERPIPLSAVAELTLREGPSEIRRIDGRRVALIQANLGEGSLGGAVRQMDLALRTELTWPADARFRITGQNEEWERSEGSLYLALGLSLFLVYVIMAAQFESLLQPLIIMVSIPLAFFGSLLGLTLLGVNLSIVVFLGFILLAGIVVNNAIVLIDYANTLKRRGLDRREAILQAGAVRLRPILMTTATTILGLLPMALGLGDGAEIRTPMALTVIFGLISSTLLTLVIIPLVYYLVDGLRERVLGPEPVTEPETDMASSL